MTPSPSDSGRSSAPPAATDRVGWLDALRGWAIVGVVLVHAGQDVPGLSGFWRKLTDAGQYGVQLFFVVSALTIFLTYERQLAAGDGSVRSAATWLTKRYFRIAPLYYYGVALYLVIFFAMREMGSHLPVNSLGATLANLAFVHSWVPRAQNTVVPGGWSIGVEMCFYLTVPLLYPLTRTVRGSLAAFAISLVLAALVDRAVAPAAGEGPTVVNNSFLYFSFPIQLPAFLAGVALFRIAGDRLWMHQGGAMLPAMICLIGMLGVGAVGLWLGTVADIDHGFAPAAMATAFCFFALLSRSTLWGKVLVNQMMVRLGRISYGVYINHFVFVLAARLFEKRTGAWESLGPTLSLGCVVAFVLVGAVLLAIQTQRFIEAPGIALGRRAAKAIEARDGSIVPRFSLD